MKDCWCAVNSDLAGCHPSQNVVDILLCIDKQARQNADCCIVYTADGLNGWFFFYHFWELNPSIGINNKYYGRKIIPKLAKVTFKWNIKHNTLHLLWGVLHYCGEDLMINWYLIVLILLLSPNSDNLTNWTNTQCIDFSGKDYRN